MRLSETDPRELESYLERQESYEGGLEPETERLVDSLQQWQYEAALQPRPGFLNEVAQQLQEERKTGSQAGRTDIVFSWMKRLLAGAVGLAAVVTFVLFVTGLFEQPPVEPAVSERQTPQATEGVAAGGTAVPSPTHVPVTINVDAESIVLIPGQNITPANYALAQDLAFNLSAEWVLMNGLWVPLLSGDALVDICEFDPAHPNCEREPGSVTPTATPLPTLPAGAPPAGASGPADTCTGLPRPALVLGHSNNLDRLTLTVVNPLSGADCSISTEAYATGTVAISDDTLYYPRREQTDGTMTIWQHPLDGSPTPLSFTTTPALSAPWFGLLVSPDGRHIVWATFSDEVEDASNARYRSTVWLGDLEAETSTLLWQENARDTLPPTIEPLHLSPDENVVYFTRAPHGIGGVGPYAARYSGLYALSLDGGDPQPVFSCETPFDFCLNDVDFERRLLATVADEGEQAALRIVDFDGAEVARYIAPDADYVADPVFSPEGHVAFVAATLERPEEGTPVFRPGAIRVWDAPYNGEPQTLAQNTDVLIKVWFWFGTNHLLASDWADGQGLALLSLSGERVAVPGSGAAMPVMVLQE